MTSIENDNSTDDKDKSERTIATLSAKTSAKSNELDPKKHGTTNIDRNNDSAEDRKLRRSNASRRNDSAENRKLERSNVDSRNNLVKDRKSIGYKNKELYAGNGNGQRIDRSVNNDEKIDKKR